MGFDVGLLLGNLLLAAFAQPGHETQPGDRQARTLGHTHSRYCDTRYSGIRFREVLTAGARLN